MSRAERKLAAIMFTDMVGYTALGQRNESLSLALVEEQRKVVRSVLGKHNAREIKTIGDAFLIEFPNAVDSVRCAYDIQRALREVNLSLEPDKRIQLRIGVHVGEVVESEGDISGDAVNLASRIEPLAEDGGVCITASVHDLVKGKVDLHFSSLGLRTLKNVAAPTEVYKMALPWEKEPWEKTPRLDTRRIAVLPFASLSPDTNDEYFADGITEEIISTISGVGGLSVISRTSVMGYKGGSKRVKEIGRELDVGTIVEGSLRRAGNKIRVSAQLIDVATDGHLWSQTYDRDVQDVFAIQSDIAQRIAESTKVQLLPSDKDRIGRVPTTNVPAYERYLKALSIIHSVELATWPEAVGLLEEAIRLDDQFASAYAELGNLYVAMAGPLVPYKEAFEKAEPLIKKALELDPNSSDGHLAKGNLAFQHRLAYDEADREFRLSIELNPNNTSAYYWRATFCEVMNRLHEALELVESARRIDPLSLTAQLHKSGVYFRMRDFGRSAAVDDRLAELHPQNAMFRLYQIMMSYLMGSPDVARKQLEEFRRQGLSLPTDPTFIIWVMAVLGETDEARRMLHDYESKDQSRSVGRVGRAYAHLALGDEDRALDILEEDFDDSPIAFLFAYASIFFDPIRDSPRFMSLVSRLNLPTGAEPEGGAAGLVSE